MQTDDVTEGRIRPTTRPTRGEVGRRGEDLAAAHLESLGMQVIDRNWRCAEGEIDVIARDGATVVFCEVKCRTGWGYGPPLESITWAKLRKLRQLASIWVRSQPTRSAAVRLDAVGVVMIRGRAPQLDHIQGIG